jgi:hypothetical protein
VRSAILAGAIALLAAAPAGAVTASDRAATDAYLQARYEFEKAVEAATPAATASLLAFTSGVEAECRGVLRGVEQLEAPPRASGPRAAGERARRNDQRVAVSFELTRADIATEAAALAPAEAAFVTAVSTLRWSDPRVAATIARELREDLAARAAPSGPELCGDLRTWAQSGFRRLAPRTREFEAQEQGLGEETIEGPPIESLLRPYVGPAERALIARTEQLGAQRTGTAQTRALLAALEKLRVAVGFKAFDVQRHEPKLLGRGRTASGATFTVSREAGAAIGRPGCRAELSVEYQFQEHENRGGTFAIGASGNLCTAGRNAQRRPALACEAGLLTIAQIVAPTVRTVRLRLADGRILTSRVLFIPAGDGGPAELYVQALRAGAAKPVSLTELGRGGAVIASVRIPAHAKCSSRAAEEPLSVELAHGTSPRGTPFTINGTYFAGLGHGSFNLDLSARSHSESRSEAFQGSPRKSAFMPSFGGECPPAEWSIVYGVLEKPGASVAAVTNGGEVKLTTAPIPARLHAGGVLAYGLFPQTPQRLVVRDGAGRAISTEDLSGHARDSREYCEGYAEA